MAVSEVAPWPEDASALVGSGLAERELVEPEQAPAEPLQERSPLAEAVVWLASPWRRALKRGIDLILSILGLIVLLPLLLVTAVAVRLNSAGPVLFTQDRIGRDGRPFKMFKFRSMYRDAHGMRAELTHLNEATGPIFKIRADPRITPVGRLIRKLSIDELPQLINVLKGDMALVGPRPPLPEEYELYGPWERQRVSVTPGITCIWQVSGRSNLDFDTWVEMDLEYIRRWSFWLDLKLLLLTIPAVISARGAF